MIFLVVSEFGYLKLFFFVLESNNFITIKEKLLCTYFFKYISCSLVFKTACVVIKVSKLVSRLVSLLLKISDYN